MAKKKNRKAIRLKRKQLREKQRQRKQSAKKYYETTDLRISRQKKLDEIHHISTVEQIIKRLSTLTSNVYKDYQTENRNNYLINIVEDNDTLYEKKYLDYLKKHEVEISYLMNKIQYESELEDIDYSYANLGKLLNVGVYSEEMGEELSYMSEME